MIRFRLTHFFAWSLTFATLLIVTSCNILNDDLPDCTHHLYVVFKYDYNMLFEDAFDKQVDKVTLYIFDKKGQFLFEQTEEGNSLTSGHYRMQVWVPTGEYQFMAWAGAHDSYEISSLTKDISNITDLKVKLKRNNTQIFSQKLEPLWYGEIIDVAYTGSQNQTETINLIKDTNKIRFVFHNEIEDDPGFQLQAYTYELIESNGYLNYDNSLLKDDSLHYRPYYTEQPESSTIIVELNTLRLMADRHTRFVVTRIASGEKVFDIDLIELLSLTKMEGNQWSTQEYLDRQDEYTIVFNINISETGTWLFMQIAINGWTHHFQNGPGG